MGRSHPRSTDKAFLIRAPQSSSPSQATSATGCGQSSMHYCSCKRSTRSPRKTNVCAALSKSYCDRKLSTVETCHKKKKKSKKCGCHSHMCRSERAAVEVCVACKRNGECNVFIKGRGCHSSSRNSDRKSSTSQKKCRKVYRFKCEDHRTPKYKECCYVVREDTNN